MKGLPMHKKDPRLPDFYYDSFIETDFQMLRSKGYSNLIIDVDNTIAVKGALSTEKEIGKKIKELLDQESVWKICLVSNIVWGKKREERVWKIAESVNVPFVTAKLFEMKPSPVPFRRAMNILGSAPENTAVIGDQMFTDIVGGNRLGLLTILINPLGPDHWATTLTGRRAKEKKILKENGIGVERAEGRGQSNEDGR